jgi:hypothetical protein
MLRFHCVELSEQNCDSSTGQEERASIEHCTAAGHLRDTVGLSNETLDEKVGKNNKRFIPFTSFNTW